MKKTVQRDQSEKEMMKTFWDLMPMFGPGIKQRCISLALL